MYGLLDCSPAFAVTVATFLGTYYLYVWFNRGNARNPPCLPSLPILGSIPFLPKHIDHDTLAVLKQQYGDIFQFYVGNRCVVVLSNFELIKEAFVEKTDDFSNRPHLYMTSLFNPGCKGIFSSSPSEEWKHTRASALTIMRDFGFGRKLIEERIQEEVKKLIGHLTTHTGKPFQPKSAITNSLANVTTSILFNKRFAYQNERFNDFLATIDELVAQGRHCQLINLFPIYRFLPDRSNSFERMKQAMKNFLTFLKEEIEDHQGRTHPYDVDVDFLSAYMYKTGEGSKSENLLQLIKDFFIAGSETMPISLCWALIMIANQPEIMRKLQSEIDAEIGGKRVPCLSDRAKLVYMDAFILELLRHSSLVNLSFAHCAARDTELGGYFIPKDATIIPNTRAVHVDATEWPNADRFDPTRFLSKDGHVINQDKIIPFSIGKRLCMGETLARQELFLYLSSMLQRLDFSLPQGMGKLPEEGVLGNNTTVTDCDLIITQRK